MTPAKRNEFTPGTIKGRLPESIQQGFVHTWKWFSVPTNKAAIYLLFFQIATFMGATFVLSPHFRWGIALFFVAFCFGVGAVGGFFWHAPLAHFKSVSNGGLFRKERHWNLAVVLMFVCWVLIVISTASGLSSLEQGGNWITVLLFVIPAAVSLLWDNTPADSGEGSV